MSIREKTARENPPCPGPCHNRRDPRKYVCGTCWHGLPRVTQQRLYLRDDKAMQRLTELQEQLGRGVPPREVLVSR